MASVDPATQTRFCDSFSASTEDIREGLSVGRSNAPDVHWTKWDYFCARVAFDPLLIAYKYTVPILNAFARDYQKGNIAPNSCAVQYITVEDAVRSIEHEIAMLGDKDPWITATGNINGRLQLQFRCYSRQDPLPSWVKPIPVQVLLRLACVAAASNYQELLGLVLPIHVDLDT